MSEENTGPDGLNEESTPHAQRADFRRAPKAHRGAKIAVRIDSGRTLRWRPDAGGGWKLDLMDSEESHELNAMGVQR